jgi:Domain of unknown function (DUF4331)
MKKTTSWMSAAASALFVLGIPGLALASSHREAPAIANDPAADNTDLYAWVEGGNLVILANYIPLEEPAGGPNFHGFSDDVLYEIHIARGPSSLEDALTYQIRFDTTYPAYIDPTKPKATPASGQEFFAQISGAVQTYQITKIVNGEAGSTLVNSGKIAPPNIGPRTNAIAYGIAPGTTYEQHFVGGAGNVITPLGAGEGRAFVGPRDDGFYVDLGAVFDLAGLRPIAGKPGIDNVAGYNTHTIALEIPLKVANGGVDVKPGLSDAQTIGVWASASRRKTSILRKDNVPDVFGPWRQVSRLGLPLINEAVIGLQDKDRWNRLTPRDDLKYFGAYFLNPVIVRDAEFAGFYAAGGPLAACAPDATALSGLKGNRTDIIGVINLAPAHKITSIGDVLRVDLGTNSGFPNGRALKKGTNTEENDVTNTELNLLLCKLQVPPAFPWDGASNNDATFRVDFPYLAAPWEGFSQGHGKVGQ